MKQIKWIKRKNVCISTEPLTIRRSERLLQLRKEINEWIRFLFFVEFRERMHIIFPNEYREIDISRLQWK